MLLIQFVRCLRPSAKARGYQVSQFSFNVKDGRCEACSGQGVNVIEMNFLPDVYAMRLQGCRYNRETLQVKYRGYTIADVLQMTVERAAEVFSAIPQAMIAYARWWMWVWVM